AQLLAQEVKRDVTQPERAPRADTATTSDRDVVASTAPFAAFAVGLDEASQQREQNEAVERAQGRLGVLLEVAQAALRRGEEAYRARNLPELPKDAPRRQQLQAAIAVPRSASRAKAPAVLRDLDDKTARICRDVLDNPLWIAADYLERSLSLDNEHALTREDPAVVEATSRYREAEERIRDAKQDLDTYAARDPTKWQRVRGFLGGKDHDDKELARLHETMEQAARGITHAKKDLDDAEHLSRAERQAELEEDRELCAAAREYREALEQPLREAVLERHVAECALEKRRPPEHLRNVPDHASLTYVGVRKLGEFEYHEFERFGGGVHLVDALELRETTTPLDLARGDRVTFQHDERGVRHLHVDERGDAWCRLRTVEGLLTEVDRHGESVRGLKIHDVSSGEERWLRPGSSNDLRTELSAPVLANIQPGDFVQIGSSHFQVIPGRPQERSRENARER
ncbi:MAG TPA: hypothetical protein VFX59_15370, partial [Polyangiales bacterium]|nr:hypothetical protein [Polyangiales bacterium]